MDSFRIRPLAEEDIDAIVEAAGGRRTHGRTDERDLPSADYILGDAIVELKMLDDEGLAKPERQKKLASLFARHENPRPVIVIDKEKLRGTGPNEYDRIVEGPIKRAVAKARKQLKQSRSEHPSANTTILFLINNGYTALGHEELLRLAVHRVRNDSSEIDGVVVAGCYFYSDGFDNYFVWPIDYVAVNEDRGFSSFETLRGQWNEHADGFMTGIVQGRFDYSAEQKAPVVDAEFDVDGVTFVKPAPPFQTPSEFYGEARPRKNSTGIEGCPPVAITFPAMSHIEWERFRDSMPSDASISVYAEHELHREQAKAASQHLQPFVLVHVSHEGWHEWQAGRYLTPSMRSVYDYANHLFDMQVRAILNDARERSSLATLPPRYILLVTEEIGQDRANDLSTITLVDEGATSGSPVRVLTADQRAFHEHALAVASAYAVAEGIDTVLWEKQQRYAWI